MHLKFYKNAFEIKQKLFENSQKCLIDFDCRTNAEELKNDGKLGPLTDHLDSETGYFVHVGSTHEIKDPPMTTELYTPLFLVSEHPVECLVFLFQMPVRLNCLNRAGKIVRIAIVQMQSFKNKVQSFEKVNRHFSGTKKFPK